MCLQVTDGFLFSGNIRVYCRVRPFLSGQNGSQSTVDLIGDGGSIVVVNPSKQVKEQRKSFTFNKVFGPCTSQGKCFRVGLISVFLLASQC